MKKYGKKERKHEKKKKRNYPRINGIKMKKQEKRKESMRKRKKEITIESTE